MFYSLIIKLGMFAATMGVVFWIGWTLPASFDRTRDFAANLSEDGQAEPAFEEERLKAIPSSPPVVSSDRQTTAIVPKQLSGDKARF
jgi:hypothetical protein